MSLTENGAKSAQLRSRRATERQRVQAMLRIQGQRWLATRLEHSPEWLMSMTLGRVLGWPRGNGRASTTAILARVSAAVGHYVSAESVVEELDADERTAVVAILRGYPIRVASHRCTTCGFEKPYVEFPLNGRHNEKHPSGGGWTDPNGMLRRSTCLRCRREEYRQGEGREYREYLPAEPFVEWLEHKFAQWSLSHSGGRVGFAATLDLCQRRLTTYLNREQDVISLKVADRVLTHEGSTSLWELWPHLYPDEEVAA